MGTPANRGALPTNTLKSMYNTAADDRIRPPQYLRDFSACSGSGCSDCSSGCCSGSGYSGCSSDCCSGSGCYSGYARCSLQRPPFRIGTPILCPAVRILFQIKN